MSTISANCVSAKAPREEITQNWVKRAVILPRAQRMTRRLLLAVIGGRQARAWRNGMAQTSLRALAVRHDRGLEFRAFGLGIAEDRVFEVGALEIGATQI